MADPVKAPLTFYSRRGSLWKDLKPNENYNFRDNNDKGVYLYSGQFFGPTVRGSELEDKFLVQGGGKFYGAKGNDVFYSNPLAGHQELDGGPGDDVYYVGGGIGTFKIKDSWGKNSISFWPGQGYTGTVDTIKEDDDPDGTDLWFMGDWKIEEGKFDGYDRQAYSRNGDRVRFNSKQVNSVTSKPKSGQYYPEPPELKPPAPEEKPEQK